MPINELIARGGDDYDIAGTFIRARDNARTNFLNRQAAQFELENAQKDRMMKEQGTNLMGAYLSGREPGALSQLQMVNPEMAMKAREYTQGQQAEAQKALTQYGLAILSIPDEQERSRAWAQVAPQLNQRFGTQIPEAYDVTAKDLLRANFGTLVDDPASAAGMLQQQLGGGSDQPMSVKEQKYFDQLYRTNPEAYEREIARRRAPVKVDTGAETILTYGGGKPVASFKAEIPPEQRPENVAARTKATELAKDKAGAIANLGKVEESANYAISVIDQLIWHPGRETISGMSGIGGLASKMRGSEAAGAQTLLDQINGQAFLEAFNALRGGGQITQVEGEKATAAMARLNTAQSDYDFLKALQELRGVIGKGLERAQSKAGAQSNVPRGTQPQQQFVETRRTKDGRLLGKTADGQIVEIK